MEKVAIPPARVMRIIWFGFILSGVMLIYVAVEIPVQASTSIGPVLEVILTVAALGDVVLGFLMPRILRRSARRAREAHAESAALNAWFRGNLAGLAWIYSCSLFAFVLHMVRARSDLVELLFWVGMASLLLWRPETPPVTEARKIATK